MAAAEKVALDSRSDAEVAVAAEADPGKPLLIVEELERLAIARRVRRVRGALGLTQEAFAKRPASR